MIITFAYYFRFVINLMRNWLDAAVLQFLLFLILGQSLHLWGVGYLLYPTYLIIHWRIQLISFTWTCHLDHTFFIKVKPILLSNPFYCLHSWFYLLYFIFYFYLVFCWKFLSIVKLSFINRWKHFCFLHSIIISLVKLISVLVK